MSKTTPSKSKSALISAFNQLVVENPYDKFHVADIIALADVSRSTFYEHFRSKDDVLRESLGGIAELLSTVGFQPDQELHAIADLLAHFREVEEATHASQNSDIFELVARLVSERIETRIHEESHRGCFPIPLLSKQIAQTSLELIRVWLSHPDPVSPQVIARQLHANARNLLAWADGESI